MSDTIQVEVDPILTLVDQAFDIIEGLRGVDVIISHETVNGRREASGQRAGVKAELSYASHLLERARVLADGEHHKITRAAKEAKREALGAKERVLDG
jgi:hypothetical protein